MKTVIIDGVEYVPKADIDNREWDIVAFKTEGEVWWVDQSGYYGWPTGWLTEKKMLNAGYTIWAVKRNADNEVFTIGNKISLMDGICKIKSFDVVKTTSYHDLMIALTDLPGACDIRYAKKVSKHLNVRKASEAVYTTGTVSPETKTEQPKRIVVRNISILLPEDPTLVVELTKYISDEEVGKVKKAIESVLNNDNKYDGATFGRAFTDDEIGQWLTPRPIRFTQSEMDKAMEAAFNAARKWNRGRWANNYPVYPTFNDYKNSLK